MSDDTIDYLPPIPPATLAAVWAAAGERDAGWNVRFLRALEAAGLALLSVADARLREPEALHENPLWSPAPMEVDEFGITFQYPSVIMRRSEMRVRNYWVPLG